MFLFLLFIEETLKLIHFANKFHRIVQILSTCLIALLKESKSILKV